MNIEQIVKDKKIKLTIAREELLKILAEAKQPVSYENIKDNISMDKATFYRNIAIFEEKEIIDSFESNDKKRYFEIKDVKHSHFVCTVCNKIECIKQKLKMDLDGYDIQNIIIKGVCKDCNS